MSITRTIRKKPRRRFPAKYTTRRAMAFTDIDLRAPANTRFLVKLAPRVISEKCKEIAARKADGNIQVALVGDTITDGPQHYDVADIGQGGDLAPYSNPVQIGPLEDVHGAVAGDFKADGKGGDA